MAMNLAFFFLYSCRVGGVPGAREPDGECEKGGWRGGGKEERKRAAGKRKKSQVKTRVGGQGKTGRGGRGGRGEEEEVGERSEEISVISAGADLFTPCATHSN